MKKDKTNYLFVYGTLLKGFNNEMSHFLAEHSQFVEKGFFNGELYEVAGYPGAILSEKPTDKVYGSVYKVLDADLVFKALDTYEGIDVNAPELDLYKRLKVKAYMDSGLSLQTWVYIYNRPITSLQKISSGSYL
ncbi:gamma-glutamylcyclotransferase family protein [Snuella sedimenti]|uniref:Gamma-glutamylcyclotransferase n=1 Tax=Snuella sedimenti TaxID=2798802 RepID=A0A8J7LST0_9FLAO|nr:gamma-glutamylcyclotransferase family protein [Snuella sedimenti]MBJ6368760.1 gamma-glutamylcyclotransferase [Snuella sedimenti]